MVQVISVSCMNAGDEAFSYANNSLLQKTVIQKAKPVVDQTMTSMLKTNHFSTNLNLADLGCSSGPNTMLAISEILKTINRISTNTKSPPQVQVFLNDLPGNDFNSVFKSLPTFYENLKNLKLGPCFVSATPGSFYERLFPDKTIHFIHSSYSNQWLSRVPPNLECNKGNIYMSKSSPGGVHEAYLEQFQRDFGSFLRLRSEEIVSGGSMVLTVIGRSIPDPTSNDCCLLWDLLTKSLTELVHEGQVKAEKVDTFNLPFYTASEEEIREIVKKEGSFNLNKLQLFEVNWDPRDDPNNKKFVFNKEKSGKNVSNCIRAVMEPLMTTHFGKTVMDSLFDKYACHVAQHLAVEKTKFVNIVVSLTKMN